MPGQPFNPRDLGEPFWVFHAPASTPLVAPKAYRIDAGSPSDNVQFEERWGIIILGIAWAVRGASAGDGFTLFARSEGIADNTLWQVSCAAGVESVGSINCYIELTPGGAASPSSNGATLHMTLTGTTPGSVMVWGVHAPAVGREVRTGSPVVATDW